MVWLHFSDVSPPFLREQPDVVLDDPMVHKELSAYLQANKYPFRSGIMISTDTTSFDLPENPEVLVNPLCVRFLPNAGFSFDHKSFMLTLSPYHWPGPP